MHTKKQQQPLGLLTTSAMWTLGANVVDKLLGFISFAILARLLTPTDFGFVAIAGSVLAFAELLSAFGFDVVIIRHPNPTKEHYSTAWTLRNLCTLMSVFLILLIAPFATKFFSQPDLLEVIFVMTITLFLSSAENIGVADFRRNFNFDLEFILRISGKVVGLMVSIPIAFIYHSYWALVLGALAQRVMITTMSYILHEFRPQFCLKKMAELFTFSIWMFATNVLNFFRGSFANVFIGYYFDFKSVGMYSISNEIAQLTTNELATPILRASFSRYVQHVNELNKLEEDFLTTASLIWMLALPSIVGILCVSNELVALMLGQQWLKSTSVLQFLVIGGGCSVMIANSYYVYLALGLSKNVFYLNSFVLAAMVIFSFILAPLLGVQGVAIAYSLSIIAVMPINYYTLWRVSGIRFTELWKRVWRTCSAALGMLMAFLFLFGNVPVHSSVEAIHLLIIKVPIGVLLYTVLLFVLWRLSGKPNGPESWAIDVLKKTVFARFTH